jgi:hypothetical protein
LSVVKTAERLVVACDTEVAHSIYGAIQEYAGFDRPEWLG